MTAYADDELARRVSEVLNANSLRPVLGQESKLRKLV